MRNGRSLYMRISKVTYEKWNKSLKKLIKTDVKVILVLTLCDDQESFFFNK